MIPPCVYHSSKSAVRFCRVAVQEIAAGRLVIVTDDEDRENEGDLIMAAAKVTPQSVA